MSFEKIAQKVIKNSIRSAVCIDDMYEQPYMLAEEIDKRNKELSKRDGKEIQLDKDIPRSLYTSFRESGICDLDIYNFRSLDDSWHPEYMLSNKDLLVIDWELEGKDNYSSTIKILEEAIETNNYTNVPFIIIYTYEPVENFKSILEQIIRNFNPYASQKDKTLNKLFEVLQEDFEGYFKEEVDYDDLILWLEQLEQEFFEFWFNTTQTAREKILSEITRSFNENFSVKESKNHKSERKFKRVLEKVFEQESDKCFEQFFYLSEKCESENYSKVDRITSSELGIKINNTILTIFSKQKKSGSGVKPEEVFSSFSDLICKDPHNFLSLLSIEMKDRLRDDLSHISNEISSFDERAFFHHMNNYKKRSENYKNEFFDFLLESWIDEMETYNFNNPPDIFSVIDEYVEMHNHDKLDAQNFKKEIGELELKLSTVRLDDRLSKSPTLRFGDILYDEENKDFYMCITPACICVDPSSKMDNNFYFIKSERFKSFLDSSAAKKIETDYYSIVNYNGELLAIKWMCRPFTLYFEINDLNNLSSYYSCGPIELTYITTSKENFAQRIANKSFSYGTSIGIDLPHL